MSQRLSIGKNEKTMGWCVERMKAGVLKRSKDHLMLLQNVPIHYAVVVVRKDGNMRMRDRNSKSVEVYQRVAVPAFLDYIREVHDYSLPQWVTVDLLGSVNLSGEDKAFFANDTKSKPCTLWRRYEDMMLKLRRDVLPLVTKYAAESESEDTLSSGTQVRDLMSAIHQDLWRQRAASREKIMLSEYETRRAQGEGLTLVTPRSPHADHQSRPPGARDAQADPGPEDAGPSPSTAVCASTSSSPQPGTDGSLSDAGEAPGVGRGASGAASESPREQDSLVEVWRDMPRDWLHPLSLVFALFGPLSETPDPDLDVLPRKGRMKRPRPVQPESSGSEKGDTGSVVSEAPSLASMSPDVLDAANTSVRPECPANEPPSREKRKRKKHDQPHKTCDEEARQAMLAFFKNHQGASQGNSIAAITAELREYSRAKMASLARRDGRRARRDARRAMKDAVWLKREEMETLQRMIKVADDLGLEEDKRAHRMRLMEVMSKPAKDFLPLLAPAEDDRHANASAGPSPACDKAPRNDAQGIVPSSAAADHTVPSSGVQDIEAVDSIGVSSGQAPEGHARGEGGAGVTLGDSADPVGRSCDENICEAVGT